MLNRLLSVFSRMASKPKVVFVLGAPGSGKGTQCQNIVEKFGFVHLSAGDLLRAERNTPGSPYGELIEKHIVAGSIVPVEITCRLIATAMQKSGTDKFLVDGFPRNQDNMNGWVKEMSDKAEILFMLFLECSEETCLSRCLNRGACGSGRSDDNAESLKKRFRTFNEETMPIVKQFETKNMVQRVDGSESPEKVFEIIEKIFKQHL